MRRSRWISVREMDVIHVYKNIILSLFVPGRTDLQCGELGEVVFVPILERRLAVELSAVACHGDDFGIASRLAPRGGWGPGGRGGVSAAAGPTRILNRQMKGSPWVMSVTLTSTGIRSPT